MVATSSSTGLQMNFRPALLSTAPGSSPASVRIWKPLQMPSTATPGGGPPEHLGHDRGARRDRAAAQVVAVSEAARQHDQVEPRQLGRRRARRARRRAPAAASATADVAIAVGAREGDDPARKRSTPQAGSVVEGHRIGLDHRIGKQLLAHRPDLGFRRGAVGSGRARARSACPDGPSRRPRSRAGRAPVRSPRLADRARRP